MMHDTFRRLREERDDEALFHSSRERFKKITQVGAFLWR